MSGTLYLVGTPIGNLGDLSVRALETLRSADFIAAEDTRVTAKLLNHFEIKKPCVSYYEHNKYASGEKIVARLLAGETCALVTDAGMPAISDPGEDIVRQCAEQGIDVQVIPGPCAAIAALAVSGLPTQQFCFEGFLAVSGKTRREHLERLRGETRTMIFYEAPHKLLRTLCDLRDTFGGAREITLARELTKLHEQKLRSTARWPTSPRRRRRANSCSCCAAHPSARSRSSRQSRRSRSWHATAARAARSKRRASSPRQTPASAKMSCIRWRSTPEPPQTIKKVP